jgi:hypothetical protein
MKNLLLQLFGVLFAGAALEASAGNTNYVNINNTTPISPFATWATAATNIQDAINVANPLTTVLVSNGVYQTGAYAEQGSNRIIINSSITVLSVNGPSVTTIKGYQPPGLTNGTATIRGVYMQSQSVLSGFTVTGGATGTSFQSGAGVFCVSPNSIITNCIITGNAANYSGGGVYNGTIINSIIASNTASSIGSGIATAIAKNCLIIGNSNVNAVWAGTANNCTITGNSSTVQGAAATALLNNCIIYYNSNGTYADTYDCTLSNCCTTRGNGAQSLPLGSFTNAPAFVDLAHGNYQLQIGSPCIDAGANANAPAGSDLAGNQRIVGGAVDIGAYENQNSGAVHYVSLSSTNPVTPYTNWSTAATNIQDAINASSAGDIVAANSGTYNTGATVVYGAESNRIAFSNGITVLAVNGPASTIIFGGTQIRCAYVGSNSLLSGFTLTNGQSSLSGDLNHEESGGGAWCETNGSISNCVISGNFAGNRNSFSTLRLGGGVFGGSISNCVLLGNFGGSGGGAASNILWNCTVSSNTANWGGGIYHSAIYNSVINSNSAIYNGTSGEGGGAFQSMVYASTLASNQAASLGGGAYEGTNFNCSIAGNSSGQGGGTYLSTNYDCFITGNYGGTYGGGAYQGLLYNCVVVNNIATNSGANADGGGAYDAELVNCTVASNLANFGGGTFGCYPYNSIIYFNTAPTGSNWYGNPVTYYSCTYPAPSSGPPGNITNDPGFVNLAAGDLRLRCGSPCIDTGSSNNSALFATNDIRGLLRPLDGNGDGTAQLDMGAYEFDPALDDVPSIITIYSFPSFATGYAFPLVADVAGCADYYWWNFGDGATATNQMNVSHVWNSSGSYNVVLSAYYSSLGESLSATTTVQVVQQPIYYANVSNTAPAYPYGSWSTASTTIQGAVNAGTIPGRLVLVTNGTYQFVTNLILQQYANVILTNAVVLQSVNGFSVTTIKAQYTQGNRCVYLGSNSFLTGFTLSGGNGNYGGGVLCEPGAVVSNCVITSCSASLTGGGGAYQGTFYNCVLTNNNALNGAGAYAATLYNCTLISNYAQQNGGNTGYGGAADYGVLYNCALQNNIASYGGGAASNTLFNCVVTGNSSGEGGGSYASTLYNSLVTGNITTYGGGGYLGAFYNCTIANNQAQTGGGLYGPIAATNSIIFDNTALTGNGSNWYNITMPFTAYDCTSPAIGNSHGTITNNPLFVNPAGGDFHLQFNSPCINSGVNSAVMSVTDLDGNPRISGGTVDIGCYEVQSPTSIISYAWLEQYGLATDGSADFADTDGDGENNYDEWRSGTSPIDPNSALRVLSTTNASPSGINVTWQSVSDIQYYLQRATNLSASAPFTTVLTNIFGQSGTTSARDASATGVGPYYYRVGVQ